MHTELTKTFINANILKIKVEQNGYGGGDAGHGGFVKIKFKNEASTCMLLNGHECDEFEFEFRGDSERDTLLDALKTVIFELENNK